MKIKRSLIILVSMSFLVYSGSLWAAESVRMYGSTSATKPLSDFVLQNTGLGKTFYVDYTNGDDGRNGRSPRTCFKTIDYAIGQCTANQGDVINVMSNHGETDGFDADVAGITIIGLGNGDNAPEITYDEVDDTVAIGAANVTIKNIRFTAGISDVVAGITVEAAGDNFTLEDCVFPKPGTATFEFLDVIELASGADGFTCAYNTYIGAGTSLTNHFVEAGNGVNAHMTITDNYIFGNFAVAAIWSNKADTDALIARNDISNLTSGQHAIEFTSTATGMIVDNKVYTDSASTSIDPGSMYPAENYVTTAIDSTGALYPAASGTITSSTIATGAISATQIAADAIGASEIADNALDAGAFAAAIKPAQLVSKAYADLTGYDDATAFAVSGDVLVHVIGVVGDTAITSTSGTTTLSVGTTEAAAGIIAASDVDNTQFAATDVWCDASPANDVDTVTGDSWRLVGGGADINLARSVDDITAGSLTLYCWWKPLSSGATVTAAP